MNNIEPALGRASSGVAHQDQAPDRAAPANEPAAAAQHANLMLLRLYAQLHGIALDSRQAMAEFSDQDQPMDLGAAVKALQVLRFETGVRSGTLGILRKSSLPALTFTKDGQMLLVGEVGPQDVTLQRAGQVSPERLKWLEFERAWSGQWITARLKPPAQVHRGKPHSPGSASDGSGHRSRNTKA